MLKLKILCFKCSQLIIMKLTKAQSTVYYREIIPDNDFSMTITDDFAQYFPRRTAIDPAFVVVITWDLMTNASQGVSE